MEYVISILPLLVLQNHCSMPISYKIGKEEAREIAVGKSEALTLADAEDPFNNVEIILPSMY